MLPSSQSPLMPANKAHARGAARRPAVFASAAVLAVLAPLMVAAPASGQNIGATINWTHDEVQAQDESTGCVFSVTVLGPHRDPNNSFNYPQDATAGNGKTVFTVDGRTLSWEGEAGLNDENLQSDGSGDGNEHWVRHIFAADMSVSIDGVPHGTATGAPAAALVPQTDADAMPTDPAQYAASWSGSVSGLSVGQHKISMKPSYLSATQSAPPGGDRQTSWFKGGSSAGQWEWLQTTEDAPRPGFYIGSDSDIDIDITICPAVTPPVTETATATVTQTVTATATNNVTSTVESTVTQTAPGTTSWLTAPGSTTTVTGPGSTEIATKTVVVDAAGNPADEGLAKTGIGPWTPWLALGGLAAAAIGCVFAIRRRADHA